MSKEQETNIMVDIETLGTDVDAVILSIGAVAFDEFQVLKKSVFYIELDGAHQPGRKIDFNPVVWWSSQPIAMPHGKVRLKDGLLQFGAWMGLVCRSLNFNDNNIWCKGTDFDTALLAHAYTQCGLDVPWKYNKVRDCRTLFAVHGEPKKKATHLASEDAIIQAERTQEILSDIGYWK